MFTMITIVCAVAVFILLTFHRFWATNEQAAKNLVFSRLLGTYINWLKARTAACWRNRSRWTWSGCLAFIKSLPVWSFRMFEKWLFLLFYLSFLYLAASGIFFALFITRGMYGYPLLMHVAAGGIFAICLTIIVITKARDYIEMPRPLVLDISLFDPRRLGITTLRAEYAAFWVLVAAGFLLIVSTVVPMMPFTAYGGQKLMLEIHRYSALAAVVAAVVFADLEFFMRGRKVGSDRA